MKKESMIKYIVEMLDDLDEEWIKGIYAFVLNRYNDFVKRPHK